MCKRRTATAAAAAAADADTDADAAAARNINFFSSGWDPGNPGRSGDVVN